MLICMGILVRRVIMRYIYEMHCHTGCTSRCGRVAPEEIVRLYKEKGYNGIVVTDHYSPMTFIPNWNPQKQVDFYLEGYRRMKAAADDDFTVLLGMELRHYADGNDYLIYGITEEFLYNAGNLMMCGMKKMRKFCDENGFLLYQAHPYRPYITRKGVKYLDGIEVYNGKCSEKENEKFGKLKIGGSDFHVVKNLAKGGIITEKAIKTNYDLVQILKNEDFTIVKS